MKTRRNQNTSLFPSYTTLTDLDDECKHQKDILIKVRSCSSRENNTTTSDGTQQPRTASRIRHEHVRDNGDYNMEWNTKITAYCSTSSFCTSSQTTWTENRKPAQSLGTLGGRKDSEDSSTQIAGELGGTTIQKIRCQITIAKTDLSKNARVP